MLIHSTDSNHNGVHLRMIVNTQVTRVHRLVRPKKGKDRFQFAVHLILITLNNSQFSCFLKKECKSKKRVLRKFNSLAWYHKIYDLK